MRRAATQPGHRQHDRRMRRRCILGPDHEPLWVRLSVYPVGGQGASVMVADGVRPPGPDEVKGIGFYADRPEEAELVSKALPVTVGALAECNRSGVMTTSKEASVYKSHRIHTTRLFSRPYTSMIVSLGKRTPLTTNSLTDRVMRVPGEYPSEAEAIQAAMRYIDEQEAHLRDQGEEQAAPTSAATERALAHDSRSQGKQDQHTRQLRLYKA